MPSSTFRSSKMYKKKSPRGKVTPRSTPRKSKVSFASKVNQIIARNVENKMTTSYNSTIPVCTTTGIAGAFDWYLQKDWNVKIFTIPQGVTVQSRLGNQIKLKRWVIKGLIHPVDGGSVPTTLTNTSQGYVDIYFGRLLTNNEVSARLTNFLDSGSTSASPNGTMAQIFRTVNKDEYKVYYHKRFKLSPGGTSVLAPATINNDFSLVRTFGFDVTSVICKNAIIKYNDADSDPNNDMIRRVALWATYQPAVGDIPQAQLVNYTSYYNISIQSYAQFEDA